MSEKILAALKQLDPANDNHWTGDGLPRIDTVKLLAGDPSLTRETVSAACPGLVRALAAEMLAAKPAEGGQATTPATASQETPQGAASGTQSAPPGAGNGEQEGSSDGDGASTEAPQTKRDQAESLAEGQRYLAGLLEERASLDKHIAKTQEALDKLIEEGAAEPEHISTVIGGYLKSQQAVRDERAARIEAMRGIKLSEILPTKSKIDEAFRRRTERGNQRPSR